MTYLIAGVAIWALVHFVPSLAKPFRDSMVEKLGDKWRGIPSVGILLGLGLMIYGWMNISPEVLYDAPGWGMSVTGIFVLAAFYLFGVSHGKAQIKRVIRHPQLTAVILWGIGHLLSNGEDRSVVLFGGLTLWAIIQIVLINRREGAWVKPELPGGLRSEIIPIVIALVLYGLFVFWAHEWLFGVSPIPLH